jgi:hypothetical protein
MVRDGEEEELVSRRVQSTMATSLGLQALMWTTLGLLFGGLAERVLKAPLGGRA